MDRKHLKFDVWTLDTAYRLLKHENGDAVELEVKQQELLLCLIEGGGDMLTRQQIVDQVWGRVTSDNALNKKIADLRRILQDNASNPKYIKTYRQSGYAFVADVEELKTEKKDKKTSLNLGFKPLAIASGVAIAALLPLTLWLASDGEAGLNLDSAGMLPSDRLTWMKGGEFQPALSPNGKHLAFVNKAVISDPWQLYVKNLETGKVSHFGQMPQGIYYSPTWLDDDRFLALRNLEDGCKILEFSLSAPDQIKEVVSCGQLENMAPIAFSQSKNTLYYSDTSTVGNPKRIRALDLEKGRNDLITAPPSSGAGDFSLALSPDETKIAFIRGIGKKEDKLMVLDLNSQEMKSITDLQTLNFKAGWKSDAEVFFKSGPSQVSVANLETGKTRVEFNAAAPISSLDYIAKSGQYIYTQGQNYDKDIALYNVSSNTLSEVKGGVNSSLTDTSPSSTGQDIYFISDRTGLPQIWKSDGSNAQQLTFYKTYTSLNHLAVSPSGNTLLVNQAGTPFVFDVQEDGNLETLSTSETTIGRISWGCDENSLFVSSQQAHDWYIYSSDKTLEKFQQVAKGNSFFVDCKDESLIVFDDSEDSLNLYSMTGSLKQSFNLNGKVSAPWSWGFENNTLFYTYANKLYRWDLRTESPELVDALTTEINALSKVKENNFLLGTRALANTSVHISKKSDQL